MCFYVKHADNCAPNEPMLLNTVFFDMFQAWLGGPHSIGQKVFPNGVFYISNLSWCEWVSKQDFWKSSCNWLFPPLLLFLHGININYVSYHKNTMFLNKINYQLLFIAQKHCIYCEKNNNAPIDSNAKDGFLLKQDAFWYG